MWISLLAIILLPVLVPTVASAQSTCDYTENTCREVEFGRIVAIDKAYVRNLCIAGFGPGATTTVRNPGTLTTTPLVKQTQTSTRIVQSVERPLETTVLETTKRSTTTLRYTSTTVLEETTISDVLSTVETTVIETISPPTSTSTFTSRSTFVPTTVTTTTLVPSTTTTTFFYYNPNRRRDEDAIQSTFAKLKEFDESGLDRLCQQIDGSRTRTRYRSTTTVLPPISSTRIIRTTSTQLTTLPLSTLTKKSTVSSVSTKIVPVLEVSTSTSTSFRTVPTTFIRSAKTTLPTPLVVETTTTTRTRTASRTRRFAAATATVTQLNFGWERRRCPAADSNHIFDSSFFFHFVLKEDEVNQWFTYCYYRPKNGSGSKYRAWYESNTGDLYVCDGGAGQPCAESLPGYATRNGGGTQCLWRESCPPVDGYISDGEQYGAGYLPGEGTGFINSGPGNGTAFIHCGYQSTDGIRRKASCYYNQETLAVLDFNPDIDFPTFKSGYNPGSDAICPNMALPQSSFDSLCLGPPLSPFN